MESTEPCPCGTSSTYGECCGALHGGQRQATTALELMRSRYSAYAVGDVPYLVATLHPDQHRPDEAQNLTNSIRDSRWHELRILDAVDGGVDDRQGIVEFEAKYTAGGQEGVLRERSRFVRHEGRWHYTDGEFPSPVRRNSSVGRNDPCPCGSGKKFRKCCYD